MKFNIGDKVHFAIPVGQVGSFNPSEECADGDWSGIVYVDGMKPYLNKSGVVEDFDSEMNSYKVEFEDREYWWIPASFLFKTDPTLYLIRGVPGVASLHLHSNCLTVDWLQQSMRQTAISSKKMAVMFLSRSSWD